MLILTAERERIPEVIDAIRAIVGAPLYYAPGDGDIEEITYSFWDLPEEKEVEIETVLAAQFADASFAWL